MSIMINTSEGTWSLEQDENLSITIKKDNVLMEVLNYSVKLTPKMGSRMLATKIRKYDRRKTKYGRI